MKYKAIFIGIFLSMMILFGANPKNGEFPVLKGPYLGQKPPGMKPEIFAQGIITTDKSEGCSG